ENWPIKKVRTTSFGRDFACKIEGHRGRLIGIGQLFGRQHAKASLQNPTDRSPSTSSLQSTYGFVLVWPSRWYRACPYLMRRRPDERDRNGCPGDDRAGF